MGTASTSIAGISIPESAGVEGTGLWNAVTLGESLVERNLYWRTPGQMALRRGDWKLVITGNTLEGGAKELFNLADDPFEKKDLAEKRPEILSSLLEEIKKEAALDGI